MISFPIIQIPITTLCSNLPVICNFVKIIYKLFKRNVWLYHMGPFMSGWIDLPYSFWSWWESIIKTKWNVVKYSPVDGLESSTKFVTCVSVHLHQRTCVVILGSFIWMSWISREK